MSANSNRQFSRRPSVGKTISRAAGLLTSACLVAVMTVWATSSPFSPLSPQSDVETARESSSEPFLMLQKVKNAFAVSDSVLPSPTIKPEVVQLQEQIPPALTETGIDVSEQIDSDELTQLEKAHALQQEDRTAWLSFRRQEPLSVTKPVARTFELPLKEDMAMEAADLPEVHFASGEPLPLPMQINQPDSEAVPQLPTQLTLTSNKSSDMSKEEAQPIKDEVQPTSIATEQPPARVATLPVPYQYITPFGNTSTSGTPAISPTLPEKKSWETGLY